LLRRRCAQEMPGGCQCGCTTGSRVSVLLLARPREGGGSRGRPAARWYPPQAGANAGRRLRLEGLGNIEAIRRLLEIAATDAFSLENSVQRVRALIATAQAAAKLLETGELEERLASLEDLLRRRREQDLEGDPGI
jgi:hypothetical protein